MVKYILITNKNIISVTVPHEVLRPCSPSPCGVNAVCKEQNNVGSCTCLPDHIGNPYESCRPECVHNSDCPSTRACINNKCQDPCPGTCGQNAYCQVSNHLPKCYCNNAFTGDPFRYCHPFIQESKTLFSSYRFRFILHVIIFSCLYETNKSLSALTVWTQ